jgi:hypothetical protein
MQEPAKLKWGEKSMRVYSYIADNCEVIREKLRFLIAPGSVALFRDIIPHQLTNGSGHF